MSRNPAHPILAVAAALVIASALTTPASAWPFGASKPATPAVADPNAPRKAAPEERAAAARLDPLVRAAFWQHELEIDPGDAQAGIGLAGALRALGKNEEAADAADRVSLFAPKNEEALLESARDHIAAGRGFYAIQPLKAAEALSPKDWRPVSLMGVALEQSQRPDEALAAYDQALRLSPNNPAVLSNLAMFHATRGDPARAEALLRTAAVQPAATAQERQNLALVLGLEGKLGEAERLMRQDLPPETADANLAYFSPAPGALRATLPAFASPPLPTSGPASGPALGPAPARTWGSVEQSDAKGG